LEPTAYLRYRLWSSGAREERYKRELTPPATKAILSAPFVIFLAVFLSLPESW